MAIRKALRERKVDRFIVDLHKVAAQPYIASPWTADARTFVSVSIKMSGSSAST